MGIFKRLANPELFQGSFAKKRYFEGWFYKLISADGSHVLAVIPGMATGKNGKGHSFIQINDSVSGQGEYIEYPRESFYSNPDVFFVKVGSSSFSRNHISLDVKGRTFAVKGELAFSDKVEFPKTFFRKGIMGPYTFVPFMECYHGIVNISHRTSGSLSINNTGVCFDGGRGYIEKDWGTSFPSSWIWLHGECFQKQEGQALVSIADIPWIGRHFTGVISFLYHNGGYIPLASYNGAVIKALEISGRNVYTVIENSKFILEAEAESPPGGRLLAPSRGMMNREIEESVAGRLKIRLSRQGKTIFEDECRNAGIELCNAHHLAKGIT